MQHSAESGSDPGSITSIPTKSTLVKDFFSKKKKFKLNHCGFNQAGRVAGTLP
jgi:hypothetical protein